MIIGGGVDKENSEVERYINGIRFDLQDNIGLNLLQTVGEYLELAIRA